MGGLRTVNLNSALLPPKPMGWGLESPDVSPGRTSKREPVPVQPVRADADRFAPGFALFRP